jgi:ferredoxin
MTYVVTEKCVDCKYTTCVAVEAIYPDMDVPDELQEWTELNEQAEEHPQIVGQSDPLKGPKCVDPNADQ